VTGALTRATGRGALINLGFAVVVQGLAAVQALLVPRLIGPEQVGLFALAMGGVAIGNTLKELGIPQKLVQERDVDLHTSYRVAFTLELVLAGCFLLVVLAAAPILAAVYDRPELWLLTTVLGLSIFTVAFLDLPAALPYRQMRYGRYNALIAIGPVVGFAVTVPLAYAGAGVWSLAAGTLAGFVAASVVMFVAGPVRPALLWDRALVRRYVAFGGPLWLGQLLAVAAGWGSVFAVSSAVGVAGLGYFQLAQSWAARALQIDGILSNTVFPALCNIQSSIDRLRRAFIITNRLSMLWAAPVGFGIALFAEPVVRLLLGPSWEPAVLLVQAQGAGVVVTSIAYNWHLFFAARGETRPQLVVSLLGVAWLVVVVIPLLLVFELEGAAASVVILAVGTYVVRQRYLRRVFGPFNMLGLVWRELAAGAGAAAVLLALQGVWEIRTIPTLLAQTALYVAVAGGLGVIAGGAVLRQVLAAVRGGGGEEVAEVASAVDAWATPSAMAFPLGVAHDGGAVWVTTRDWPALGRLDLSTGEWRWTELPVFPHLPTPDGAGGCWAALTRSSAVAHVDAAGRITFHEVPKSKELLVAAWTGTTLWVVDADRRRLLGVAPDGGVREVALPATSRRPDFVTEVGGILWIGDTHVAQLVRVDAATGSVDVVPVPHPCRFVVPDGGAGLWIGASDRGCLSHVTDGTVDGSIDLPGIPFGIAVDERGQVATAVRDLDTIVIPGVGTIPLPNGSAPMGLARGGGRWWVACAGSSQVVAVDDDDIEPSAVQPVSTSA
jgi:lipopolysaccharide exporter